jgi:hypothetical protein
MTFVDGTVPKRLLSLGAREVWMHFFAGREDLCGRMFAPVVYYIREERRILSHCPAVVVPLTKACLNQRLYTAKMYLSRC